MEPADLAIQRHAQPAMAPCRQRNLGRTMKREIAPWIGPP
jgi:hypothetical protein